MEELDNVSRIGHYISGDNISVGDLNVEQMSLKDKIEILSEKLNGMDRTKYGESHFKLFDMERSIQKVHNDGNYDIMLSSYSESLKSDNESCIKSCVNILNRDKVLLITGSYGQGKTMLTKLMQLHYRNNGVKTVFFRAHDLVGIIKEDKIALVSVLSNLIKKEKTERLIVFIDSVDELNYDNLINILFVKVFRCIKQSENISFVINSRVFIRIKQPASIKRIEEIFSEDLFDTIGVPTFYYVKMKNLSNSQIDNLFHELNRTSVFDKDLRIDYVKKSYKHIVEACKIPLFSYVIGDYYYNNGFNLPKTLSDVYKSFISKTIKGKFSLEYSGNPLILEYETAYRDLLKRLAISMLNNTSQYLNYNNGDGNFFSENFEYSFYIGLSKLSFEAGKIYGDNSLYKDYYSQEHEDNKNADFLNCYFFKVCKNADGDFFAFSDEYTMCYLASEYVYDSILPFINNNNETIYENLINTFDSFFPHPIAMDFLIERINQIITTDPNKRNNIINNIKKVLNDIHKYYSQNTQDSVIVKGIMAQIILRILFIKFFRDSYKNIEGNHFFKHFYLLGKIAKAMELNGQHSTESGCHRYLVERYFSDCVIADGCCRRLNLKYYNFNRSELKNCKFSQCKFFECSLKDTKFIGNTEFDLCDINKVVFSPIITGKTVFRDSIVINCQFVDVCADSIVLFDNCRVANLELFKKDSNQRIRVIFRNCNIHNIIVNGCKASIGIYRCILPNQERIKIKNCANVTLSIYDNICEIHCDSDNTSEFKLASDYFYSQEIINNFDWRSYQ